MLLKMTSEKLSNKTIDHLEESFKLLKESVVKDYYFFKMNLQPNIRKNINRATIDFLCELIDKEHLYIEELQKKYNKVILNKKKENFLNKKDTSSNLDLSIFLTKNNLNESNSQLENSNKYNSQLNNINPTSKKILIKKNLLSSSLTIDSNNNKNNISKFNSDSKNDNEKGKKKKSKSINVYKFNEIQKYINYESIYLDTLNSNQILQKSPFSTIYLFNKSNNNKINGLKKITTKKKY